MGTRCKASALPRWLGSLRLPHSPQPRRRNRLQTINQGVGPFYSIGVGPFYVVKATQGRDTRFSSKFFRIRNQSRSTSPTSLPKDRRHPYWTLSWSRFIAPRRRQSCRETILTSTLILLLIVLRHFLSTSPPSHHHLMVPLSFSKTGGSSSGVPVSIAALSLTVRLLRLTWSPEYSA